MPETSNSLLLTTNWLVARVTIGNYRYSVMDLQWLQVVMLQQWVKHLQIYLKDEIPYYHPLTDWLLGTTIGNHGVLVMDLQWL